MELCSWTSVSLNMLDLALTPPFSFPYIRAMPDETSVC